MRSRLLITFILTLCFSIIQATNRPVVCFETDSLIIKSDTTAFFLLLEKHYSNDYRHLIKSEVRYRLSVSKDNEAKMDGMNLNCYTDKERRAYDASCLNYKEPLVLIQHGQAKVFYKYPMIEITSIKVKKTGSKFCGKIQRLYIDKTTDKIFYKESIYGYKWWKPSEGREY